MRIALCYDKTKDELYIGSEIENNVLFVSHEGKGYKYNQPKFSIPETNFSIKIESNFKYGNRAYLRASMWNKDISLLNFHNWCNSLNFKPYHFEVEPTPENWEELFTKIIEVYKHRDSWNYNSISTGLNDLDNALSNPEKITICNRSWLIPKTTWNEPLSILHLTQKTHELLNELKTLKVDDIQHFKEVLNSITLRLIPLIITQYKCLFQEKQNAERAKQANIIKNINEFETYFDSIYAYLKRTEQLNLFFTNL